MALTLAQKSSVRRHLKFPVIGNITTSPGGGTFAQGAVGYRFFQASGFLEYKMNNLAPDEEARITGAAYAAAAFVGAQPHQGDQVSLVLSGGPIASPQTLTVTAGAPIPNQDMRLPLIQNLASLAAQNGVLQAAGVIALAPYGTGAFSMNAIPIPEIAFTAPTAFSIAGSGTGVVIPQITANGVQLPPTASLDGGNTTLWGYLPILDALEGAYLGTSDNLDTSKADVWTARANEAGQRRSLYEGWVSLFADFLGLPTYPQARQRPQSTGAIRYV
jgi:hypothetical protein